MEIKWIANIRKEFRLDVANLHTSFLALEILKHHVIVYRRDHSAYIWPKFLIIAYPWRQMVRVNNDVGLEARPSGGPWILAI